MMRTLGLFCLLFAGLTAATAAPGLLANGGFEEGSAGWTLVMGGYRQDARPDELQAHARVVEQDARTGKRALLLDAVGLDHEVDAYSRPVPVQAGVGYRLEAFVRQTAGDAGYKVTLDWQDAAGKHLSYANDWQGRNRPAQYEPHGGIFIAPPKAARVVLILGVQKDARCLFDDLTLTEMGVTEPLDARKRRDGDGTLSLEGPATVDARGFGSWRALYTCGESGLPVGGSVVFRRWPVSFDWSPAQGTRPKEPGFVTIRGPKNALFAVDAGRVGEVVVKLLWPALMPREQLEITVGDTGQGGPGMRVQGKAQRVRWIAASDCDADGEYRDLGTTAGGAFAVVPGAPAVAWVVAPAVATAGKPMPLRLEVRDAAGNPTDRFKGSCSIVSAAGRATHSFDAGTPAVRDSAMTWGQPGLYTLSARAEGLTPAQRDAWVVVTRPWPEPPATPGTAAQAEVTDRGAVLANEHVALLLPRNPEPLAWGCARLLVRDGASWQPVATLPAAGRALFGKASPDPVPGDLFFATEAKVERAGDEASLSLSGTVATDAGSRWPFTLSYHVKPGEKQITSRFSLRPAGAGKLVALHAPLLYPGDGTTGERKAGALFPGLEFLTAEERSSDDVGVSLRLADRWRPHPYQVTVPLMAVGLEGAVVGLSWDPLQRWDGEHRAPAAHFASPNRREDKPNHLLALSLPGLSRDFGEGAPGAAGAALASGRPLTLAAEIIVLPGTSDVADAVEHWARTHPIPAPKPPRTPEEGLALATRGLLETAWDPKAKGWITAIGWEHGFRPDIAERLLQVAALGKAPALSARARAQAEEAVAAAGAPRGAALHLRLGDAESAVADLRTAAASAMATQHADGAWAFADVYSTEGMKATMAQPEDVEIGTCVNVLDGLLAYAVATGDPAAVEAGLRGLEYIRRFTKPAGSEAWEVPLPCPNLRAAALAARCFLRGWQLTGKEEYLRLARRWAWAGAAFIYLWEAPDRPVMPGASISVFGSTFYDHPWYGYPVQWVGLVYAEALQELACFDDSFDWRRLAELITVSALHQQKTEAAPCKHVGFYPDAYSMVKGADYYEWCLAPTGIASNLLAMRGYLPGAQVRALDAGEKRVHLLAVAQATGWKWDPAGNARLRLRAAPGERSQVVLFGLAAPKRVTWNGKDLPRLDAPAAKGEGWWTAPRENALVLSLRWPVEDAELSLEGTAPVAYQPPGLPDRLANGGFEDGLAGWACDPVVTRDTAGAHAGKAALRITAPDPKAEGQAHGTPMRVRAGQQYRLRAWVRQLSGEGDYKVTIDWLNFAGAHVAYDNDWKGTDRPGEYREHGGVFRAPDGAAQARIILGCRAAVCLFDDVSLEPTSPRAR